ncbi:TonB-dependent receptor plug domain-containing protein [Adhaeribacter swui]|uniref:TonB-dependent receptor plug domain-containing protein n=1 Tax=Adhaeribacter swui TaxID=2086471 RepID=UPI001E4B23DE|nr:TonB-dependent receptor [Adhaeribacter swui]
MGNDPQQRARFWQWPYWNKESLYFVSTTGLGANSALKTRVYYDQFRNLLKAFDDKTYTTQNRPSSFQSFYHDDTYGAAVEYHRNWPEKHALKAALQYKNDQHQEYNLGEPERTFRDYTASLGIEDTYQITDKLTLLPGISLNLRHSLEAQNYNATTKEITDLPENENYAFNAQVGVLYQLTAQQRLSFSVARKSRFATIKDRYSYRMGAAIPNPDLKAETALHYEASYQATFQEKWQVVANLFYSRIQDVIQQVNNVQPNIFQLQNTGKAAFSGAEFSAQYPILTDWKAGGQYSYLHRVNRSNKDLKFIDAPEHKVLVFSSYTYQDRGGLTASAEYNSSRYSTSYGIKSAGFTLLNLRAQVKVYRGVSVEGGVNNLFDKNYTLVEGFPEAGRNYFVNLVFSNL